MSFAQNRELTHELCRLGRPPNVRKFSHISRENVV
jgi:hypothetical protein